jgi:hypothetical protein
MVVRFHYGWHEYTVWGTPGVNTYHFSLVEDAM